MDTEYASNAKANTGVALGSVGTGLSVLNTLAGGLMGFGGTGRSQAVTQEQMRDQQTISSLQSSLALADAKYANETGENAKIVELYKATASRDKEVEGRLTALEERTIADRTAFAEYRASQAEIQRLRDENMRLYIDNKVCPVNGKADMALAYINKVAAVGVANTSVFTAPTTTTAAVAAA